MSRQSAWQAGYGGVEGNERLTVLTGWVLVLLLAALGATIVAIGQLIWLHLFLGLLLIGPLALKLASTGWRFALYYTANPRYRAKGPPAPALRLLAPVVVGLTLVVFASGVALLAVGPSAGADPPLRLLHKASFILWLAAAALHVIAHLPEMIRFNRCSARVRADLNELRSLMPGLGGPAAAPLADPLAGRGNRWLSVAAAVGAGLVLAIALIPSFAPWTGARSLREEPAVRAAERAATERRSAPPVPLAVHVVGRAFRSSHRL
ncbi:MAG: hypothetical protein ACRDMX_14440 [Solirubrobacteraceae bacterium]